MYVVELPISKSIANRLLVRAALRGDVFPKLPDDSLPDDVALLRSALTTPKDYINVNNCGTAMRFLTAYYAQKEGRTILIDGNQRMRERPIGTLVDALHKMGADISYLGKDNFPPLYIHGKRLHGTTIEVHQAESTQFISALLLISDFINGELRLISNIESPYIDMTKHIISHPAMQLERDWSSASYWYEFVALHNNENILLKDLTFSTIQGDVIVSKLFKHFGVTSEELPSGILLSKERNHTLNSPITIDFSLCPDLYPAIYVTATRLGVELKCIGTERLVYKESNRLTAFRSLTPDTKFYPSFHDHRIAMALLMADIETDDLICTAKSYPNFIKQWKECR